MTALQLEKGEAIYFAYGTLLELKSMQKYCPSVKSLGIYRLKDFRLDFKTCGPDPATGGCTLTKDPENIMYGVLYKMPTAERLELDKVSGLDKGLWAKFDITLLDDKDGAIPANTYIIPNPSGPQSPSAEYVRPIIAGAAEIQLPQDYINQLTTIIKNAM